jgi:pimeloyl-ACP methyl ester carboxylesterase
MKGHSRSDGARRRAALAVLAAVAVSSLVFWAAAPMSGASGASTRASLTAAAWHAPNLNWQACQGAAGVQCARLRVPLDWSRPAGPEVTLALTRLRATDPARRVGTVLFNCGGPGCPSAQEVKRAPDLFTARLHQRFDIVGFDPRGTGESTPVRCGLPALDPSIPRYPDTQAGYARLVAFNRALARSCQKLTGSLLMHISADEVVRDMEGIREALRDGKLNWLGLSYGTMLGALYAERYPTHIRAMVLDGALDRALSEPVMLSEEARSSENELVRWADWCKGSHECPLHGRDVLGIWDHLIARANRSPIPAPSAHRVVTGEEIEHTADSAYLLFKQPNAFSPIGWAALGSAVLKALHGDASQFAIPMAPPPDNPNYGARAIQCLDFSLQATSFAEFSERIRIARLIAPHLGGATQTGRVISECSGWPRPPTDPRHFLRITGAPPTLIVNATHDPSTSYTWALSMQAQFPRSVLLTRAGDGHTSYLTSPCAQHAIDRYLINLTVPHPGTVCHS